MDSEENSKENSNSSNKEFSLKDASLIIGLQPIKVNNNPEEEEICFTEKTYKHTKSSHIQTVLTSNNKLKVKIKTDSKSIDVLMKKAYDLRRSNFNFSLMLKNEKEKRNQKEKELHDESSNLERVDDINKTFRFNLTRKHTERAKSQDKSEQLGRLCNELILKLKDMPSRMEKYEQDVENLKMKLIETKDRYMKELCQQELEKEKLKQKSKYLDKVCDGQKTKIEELKQLKEKILKDRELQQQEFVELQKKYKLKQQELDRNFNSLQQTLFEREMTNKVIDKKNKEHEKTRTEIQKMKNTIENLQSSNVSLKEKVKELKLQASKVSIGKKSNNVFSSKRKKKI